MLNVAASLSHRQTDSFHTETTRNTSFVCNETLRTGSLLVQCLHSKASKHITTRIQQTLTTSWTNGQRMFPFVSTPPPQRKNPRPCHRHPQPVLAWTSITKILLQQSSIDEHCRERGPKSHVIKAVLFERSRVTLLEAVDAAKGLAAVEGLGGLARLLRAARKRVRDKAGRKEEEVDKEGRTGKSSRAAWGERTRGAETGANARAASACTNRAVLQVSGESSRVASQRWTREWTEQAGRCKASPLRRAPPTLGLDASLG